MTTLQINDLQVESLIAKYGQDEIIQYIKTFKPKLKQKNQNTIEEKIRALKITKPDASKSLEEAFDYLHKECQELGTLDFNDSKDSYMHEKYGV